MTVPIDAPPTRKTRKAVPVWLVVVCLPYIAFLLVVSLFQIIGPERWWLTGIFQYAPQWLLVLPAVPLLSLALLGARRAFWLPLLLGLWAAIPLMDLRLNLHRLIPTQAKTLRVMTYNIKWGWRGGPAAAAEIAAAKPDVIVLQDSDRVEDGILKPVLQDYTLRRSGQYLVASRLPFGDLQRQDISFPGSNHHATRFVLNFGGREIAFYNVHLLSPRGGLYALKFKQKQGVESNLVARLFEAKRLAEYVSAERIPVILAGDLNAPDSTLVCRNLFDAGLHDAFAEAGIGYGYTYGRHTFARSSSIRIDHVLMSRDLTTVRCWAGNDAGSDHRPVIADIAWR